MADTMAAQRAYDKKVKERRKKMFAKAKVKEAEDYRALGTDINEQIINRHIRNRATEVKSSKLDSPKSAPVSSDYGDTVKAKRAGGKKRSKAMFDKTKSLFSKWVAAGKESSKKKREENKKKMMRGPVYRTKK